MCSTVYLQLEVLQKQNLKPSILPRQYILPEGIALVEHWNAQAPGHHSHGAAGTQDQLDEAILTHHCSGTGQK